MKLSIKTVLTYGFLIMNVVMGGGELSEAAPVYSGSSILDVRKAKSSDTTSVGDLTVGAVRGFFKSKDGTYSTDPRNYKATFFSNTNDYMTQPNTIMFGGHTDGDDAFMKVIGSAAGHGDTGGSVVSISNSPYSSYGNRNGAGLSDSITLFMGANASSPRFEIGQDITSSDNTQHTILQIGDGYALIYPSLTDADKATFAPFTRIYSNWKHGNIYDSTLDHPLVMPNAYYAYFDKFEETTAYIHTASDGTVSLDTDADATAAADSTAKKVNVTKLWVIYNPDYGESIGWTREDLLSISKAAAPPGTNSGDTLDNMSDTTNTDNATRGTIWGYAHPALFVGMPNKLFAENTMFGPAGPAIKDSITRELQGEEWDFLFQPSSDYEIKAGALAINFNTNGHRLADGSQEVTLGGTGIPTMLGIGGDAEAVNISSPVFWAGAYGFGSSDFANAVGYEHPFIMFSQSTGTNSENGQTSGGHTNRFFIAQERMVDSSTAPSGVALEFINSFDGSSPHPRNSDPSKWDSGTRQMKEVWWNTAFHFCNYGQDVTSAANTCTATIGSDGLTLRQPLTVQSRIDLSDTNALFFANASMFNAAYVGSHENGDLYVGTGVNNGGGLTLSGRFNTGHWSYSSIPTVFTNAGDVVFCTDCYSSLQSATQSGKKGIYVMYANGEWEDLLGNAVQH